MTILHFKVLYSLPCTNRSGSHEGGPYKTYLILEIRYKHMKKKCMKWVDRLMTKKFCCMRKWSGLWRVSVYVCVCLHAVIAAPTLSVQKRSKFPQILLPLNITNCHIHIHVREFVQNLQTTIKVRLIPFLLGRSSKFETLCN